MALPTPHYEKLAATLANEKLPNADLPRVQAAIERYKAWITEMDAIAKSEVASDVALGQMVDSLNRYKNYIDLELIFDSPENFLYRQKGQLKLDNSIIEEFLPWLTCKVVLAELPEGFNVGPQQCYSAIYFETSLKVQSPGSGIRVRTKAQDFALSRRLYIKASHSPDFAVHELVDTQIALVATEIKTNLDKTMFQEACATARDLRMAVPGARYFLVCEWLDMTPVSTAPTDIEEVLILRRAKRLGSNIRKNFDTAAGRAAWRDRYKALLESKPFRVEVFQRWIDKVKGLLMDEDPIEDEVLDKGYF